MKLLRPIHVSKWKMVNTEEEVGGNIDIILMVYFDSIIRHWFVGITSENKKKQSFQLHMSQGKEQFQLINGRLPKLRLG